MLITFIIAAIIIVLIIVLCIVRWKRRKPRQEGAAGDAGLNRQLYIGNLSYQITEQDLKEYFVKYGSIEQVRIVRNYHSGRCQGVWVCHLPNCRRSQ